MLGSLVGVTEGEKPPHLSLWVPSQARSPSWMPCAHWAAASRALSTFAAPHGAWGRARCQGTWHRILRGLVAGRAGRLLCFPSRRPRAPTWGVFQDSKPVGPGTGCVLGGRGSTRKGGAGDVGCLRIQGPLGLLAGEDTWRPECWPGRVRTLSTQPVPSSPGLGPVEAGREGRVGSGSSSSSSTHGGWQCVRRSVCRALHGAGGSGPLPSTERLPGRDQGHGWYRAVQWSAAMRRQESVRGSRWQGPESMGQGSRKVLRIWVSAWAPEPGRVQSRGGLRVLHPAWPSTGPRLRGPLGEGRGAPRRPLASHPSGCCRQPDAGPGEETGSAGVCWGGSELGALRVSPLSPQPDCFPEGPHGPRRAGGQVEGEGWGEGAGLLVQTHCRQRRGC